VSQTAQFLEQAKAAVQCALTLDEIDSIRVKFLGRKGVFTVQLKELGKLPAVERPAAGQVINEAKHQLMSAIRVRQQELERERIQVALTAEALDVALPGRGQLGGSIHPITRTIRRMQRIFVKAGFEVYTGPEIEDEFHNFSALNILENHPARAMHDTFYLESGLLLRTHTSPVQIRAMEENGVPIRLIAPGRAYRCDSDLTHSPMFNQIEVLAVDRGISFANLKSCLYQFLSNFFERDVELRFRPSYFPFTEPSAEVDVLSENGQWLEILGCGMVHPNVLRGVGVDPEEFTGYALGFGVERLAMLRYGVKDLRLFFENDLRFLEQFQ